MVSFDEPLADAIYARAVARAFPELKRLHGVVGAGRAYALAARMVDSPWFVLMDADFVIDPDFSLTDAKAVSQLSNVIVWRSRNPVNGLEYGYGGIKYCRTSALLQLDPGRRCTDALAGFEGLHFLDKVGGTTMFNQSPLHAWRAGFRETLVLLREDFTLHAETRRARLNAWREVAFDVPNAGWATAGASDAHAAWEAGVSAAIDVNDADCLLAHFRDRYPMQSLDPTSTPDARAFGL